MNKLHNYYILLSIALPIVSSSFAQPDLALANKLTRPVYYSVGKAGGNPTERAVNKPLAVLDPSVGTVALTVPYNIGRAGTELLIKSNPGEAELFTFIPGKTIYVDITDDKAKNVIITPQSGTISSLWRKTERGYPLDNNVTKTDIVRKSLSSHDIPNTNPQAFLTIFKGAEPRIILGIPAGRTPNGAIVNEKYSALAEKWHPAKNKTPGTQAVYDLILKAAAVYIPSLK